MELKAKYKKGDIVRCRRLSESTSWKFKIEAVREIHGWKGLHRYYGTVNDNCGGAGVYEDEILGFWKTSMNVERLQRFVNFLKTEVDPMDFNIETYQSNPNGCGIQNTLDKARECGTVACVSGWLALWPEFQADGGYPDPKLGYAVYKSLPGDVRYSAEAFVTYFNLPHDIAESIVWGDWNFYNCSEGVELRHVVNKLQQIIDEEKLNQKVHQFEEPFIKEEIKRLETELRSLKEGKVNYGVPIVNMIGESRLDVQEMRKNINWYCNPDSVGIMMDELVRLYKEKDK